jgi:cytochrome c oxidase assembly protein subunit 11|tara:strand:- start:367 stop:804 length:438 start_codon:yes stop_codon:yes gene_type:complete
LHKNKKLIFILISVITLIIILPFLFFEKGKNIVQQIPTKLITSVHKDLPLKFESDQTNIILQPGEVQTINYSVENLGSKSVSAMATFQVYPPELKDFMTKMNCFCYEKQTLKAGAKEKYALVLLVDPNVTKNIKEAIIQFVYFKK